MNNKKIVSSTESHTRSIELVDDKIVYRLKIDGVADYLTYNDILYEILKLNKVIPFRIKFYMYDLSFACYQGLINFDNFLEDIQVYYDNKTKNGLSPYTLLW